MRGRAGSINSRQLPDDTAILINIMINNDMNEYLK